MIMFRKVRWKNLLSTGNYFTEMDLSSNSNTLIVGGNGSGKSTMLDALCFGLFGKPFRDINKPQLLNSINGKDCVVEVEFDTGNKSYKIIRGIKPNKFEIYCNGELVNQEAASRDYQEHLEKFILKLNYKSFTQIVVLGSASFTPFMQLKSGDRREIIEDLLDIQIFSTMNGLVKERLSNNKDLIAQKKHEIELATQKVELLKKHIIQLKQNNDEKVKQHESEIEGNQGVVQTLHEELGGLAQDVSTLTEQISGKLEVEDKVKKIGKLESQIETNLSKFQRDIRFFESNDSCPTCRQAIALEFKETELAGLADKVQKCNHGLSELEQKLNVEQEKLNAISQIQKDIQTKQVKIATINTTITETNKYIDKLRKQIELLSDSASATDKEESELTIIKEQLNDLNTNLRDLIDEKTYYEAASNLLKDTGIKTKIVKQYLPVINKLVNKYLASLDFFVNFNLDEAFRETIKSRHRDEFTYNNFSEGEKQRIDMALMLTWRAVAKLKNSSNTNLLILDETFDSSLDANGTEYLMNILHMLEGVNLFVISHKGDVLQDKFANVVRFEKVKNFSKVIK
jgi:DNA repair exonuclease SbcCD ATPase subunit